jgi:hypothetical protein
MKTWMMIPILAMGCVENQLPGPNAAVTVACTATDDKCDTHEACCSGYCQLTQVYLENWGTCQPPLEDGAYCTGDNECQTKKCIDYRCGGVGACEGQSCNGDADCCRGTYCYNETYAPWACMMLAENGEWCTSATHCKSGFCGSDYTCRPAM